MGARYIRIVEAVGSNPICSISKQQIIKSLGLHHFDGVLFFIFKFDYRSLYHHFECAAYMYQTACIPYIERDFQETLGKCREVTPESIKNEKFFYKALGSLMQFIAPLM